VKSGVKIIIKKHESNSEFIVIFISALNLLEWDGKAAGYFNT
jgi:hypothetical protein